MPDTVSEHERELSVCRRFSRRAALLGAGQLAAFGILGARLYELQVVDEHRYATLAEDNRLTVRLSAPERGRILDRFGTVLAANEEGYRALIVPSLARDVPQVLAHLARIIPLSEDEIARIALRVRRAPRHLPQIAASDLTFEQAAALAVLAPELPGIETERAGRRTYFHGRATSHVVGYTGGVERVALDDDPVLRLPGMRVGKSGVERGMDERLRGVAGSARHEVDARGRIVRLIAQAEPQAGRDVVLTIDADIQARALRLLSQHRRAAAVALDVEHGEIVLMASFPSYDQADVIGPQQRGSGRRSRWQRLLSTADNPMLNRAIRGLYPPGSTFKMVTALAALERGAIDLEERIVCRGSVELAGQAFRCWKRSGHGPCDLHRSLKESCDCYYYEAARRIGIDAIAAMGRRLGLGQVYGDAGIALQKKGVLPTADWKRVRLGEPWHVGETLLAGIGQGYVLATPLQLAVMAARLSSGRMVMPTLVRADAGLERPVRSPLDVAPHHVEAVRRAMTAVVHEDGGTGGKARVESPRMLVAGKTGTSQVSRRSSETSQADLPWEGRDHALFVAYFPAERPRYALSVVVEHGGSGGAVAAPIARGLIELLIDRDPLARPAHSVAATPAGDAGRDNKGDARWLAGRG